MAEKYNTDEFDGISRLLENAEVNDEMHKEKIYNGIKFKMETGAILKNNRKKDDIDMKKNFRKSVVIAVMALVCLVGGFSATAYGQETIQNIIAHFKAGNITITQYKEMPDYKPVDNSDKKPDPKNESRVTTVEEARTTMKIDFAVPTWLPEGYVYTKSVQHSVNGVELVYAKGDDCVLSLLISKGENGIGTTDDVKKETIAGNTVYFANGIVLWGQDGLTYELYQMGGEDFDKDVLDKIISTMSAETTYSDGLSSIKAKIDQKDSTAVAAQRVGAPAAR